MVRNSFYGALVAILLCGSVYGQASAGCGEIGVCGTPNRGSGAKTATPATNSRNARAAAKMNSIQSTLQTNQQILQNGANALINVLTSGQGNNGNGDSNPDVPDDGDTSSVVDNAPSIVNDTPAVDYAALAAAAAARRQAQINAEALQILQDSDGDLGAANGVSAGDSATPSASSAVNALLDSNQGSNSSNSAISALLGNSTNPTTGAPATTAASAVASLLNPNGASASASAFPAYASLQASDDPQFNAALQESADQPEQNTIAPLTQMVQAAGQQITDKLTGLVDSGKALASQFSNDPIVYLIVNQAWNGTTAPLPCTPQLTDCTQETATNLTIGQATVGLGDILEGMAAEGPLGVPKGMYNYGSKMVSQMGAYLGLATNTIFEQVAAGQQQ